MKFQVGSQGWPVTGQHLVPPSEIIDLTKDPKDFTVWEQLCVGKVPGLDATALDYDCALVLWQNYPWQRPQLRRQLSPTQESEFLRLRDDWTVLQRYWPKGRA